MKKFFAALMVVAGILAVSCGKDDNGGSIKKDGADDSALHASLKGSSYFPLLLDSESAEAIKSKIVCSLMPDDKTNNLWIWEGTYKGGEGAGLNFYGNTAGYTDLVVDGAAGWSGAGWCVYTEFTPEGAETAFVADPNPFEKIKANIGAHPNDYTFHVAYKGEAKVAHILGVDYAGGSYKFAVGEGTLGDKGVDYAAIAPVSGKFEAGEWNEYEIAVKDMGLDFSSDKYENGTNLLFCLSGGTAGVEIKLDAAFFYKK